MADAKKCDRCGVLFVPYIEEPREGKESDFPGYVNILPRKKIMRSNKAINERGVDLCADCAKSFDRWLNMEYSRWVKTADDVGDSDEQ